MRTVAALFVDPRGCYANLEGVEVWGIKRDARLYTGPHPVVAHPPCTRWCRLAGLVEARWGHKRGEDGGCFKAALEAVRRWGGVLEHPAHSDAWIAFNLPEPPAQGGWLKTFCGGWTCHVEQGRYGHRARKATWLYAHGMKPPALRWGVTANWPASWHPQQARRGSSRRRVVVPQPRARERAAHRQARGCRHAHRVPRHASRHLAQLPPTSRGGAAVKQRIWRTPPPVHWLTPGQKGEPGAIACGAKLTAAQFPTRTTRDEARVDCEKCRRVLRQRKAAEAML